jgi:hypothetical protein
MPDFYLSDWKQPFLAALEETDEDKLRTLVYAAEQAIFLRMQELGDSADHHDERDEIQKACAALLSIQVNKLGWPSSLPDRKP